MGLSGFSSTARNHDLRPTEGGALCSAEVQKCRSGAVIRQDSQPWASGERRQWKADDDERPERRRRRRRPRIMTDDARPNRLTNRSINDRRPDRQPTNDDDQQDATGLQLGQLVALSSCTPLPPSAHPPSLPLALSLSLDLPLPHQISSSSAGQRTRRLYAPARCQPILARPPAHPAGHPALDPFRSGSGHPRVDDDRRGRRRSLLRTTPFHVLLLRSPLLCTVRTR